MGDAVKVTRGIRIALTLGLLAALSHDGARSGSPDEPKPLATSRIERAGVTLLLLDVEAVDRKGHPLRGLKKDDFSVRLDFRSWPIYSVDDLCTCEGGSAATGASATSAPATAAPDPRRYILYFDFSQMQIDGRIHARAEAERSVRETMEPGDEMMLVAYSSANGLKRLTPFTSDRRLLLAAIQDAYYNRSSIETFALEFQSRVEECENFSNLCDSMAQMEYWHGRQSMKALELFMSSLESVSGRKELILFTQNGVMFPGKLYQGAQVPDHYGASQELAAAANAAQTAVYTANAGSDPGSMLAQEERVLADNLADFTGGGYNRGAYDLPGLTASARRTCRCTYRIGLVPPAHPTRDVFTAKVTAGGVVLDRRYRVRFSSERDRWLRQARAVLADPASASDLDVASAIVPESADRAKWSVEVEVAFDTRALTLLPSAAGRVGSYEVGALLNRVDRSSGTEMLSTLAVREKPGERSGGIVVHSRKIQDLSPGTYRLAAFVRDRTLNVFGGAEATITLPDPKKGGFAGPLLLLGPQARTVLPLRLFGEGAPEAPAAPEVDRGVVPPFSSAFRAGSLLSGITWICPGKKNEAPVEVQRYLSREGTPLRRFQTAPPDPSGTCLRYRDVLDTASVPPDTYAYHVRWRPKTAIPDLGTSTTFEIIDPSRGRPGAAPVTTKAPDPN